MRWRCAGGVGGAGGEYAARLAHARAARVRAFRAAAQGGAGRRHVQRAAREPGAERQPGVAERVWTTLTDDEEWQHIENLAGEWQHLDSAKQKQLLSKAIFGAALRCEARGAKGVWEPRATATALPALERPPAL